jgi:SpoVK/Ycf46/Vps4 family AAA+-type ATPase
VLFATKVNVVVKELLSGAIAQYNYADLVFADSSQPSFQESVFSIASSSGNNPSANTGGKITCSMCANNKMIKIEGARLQHIGGCKNCGRSALHTFCLRAYQCKNGTCNTLICDDCQNGIQVKGIPLTPNLFEVSSTKPQSSKDNLANEDLSLSWTSAGKLPHWVELTFPPAALYPDVQIYTTDHASCSPFNVSVFFVDGISGTPTKVKTMALSTKPAWVTLLTSAEMLAASPSVMPAKVKIQVDKNHQGGADSTISAIRLLQTPPLTQPLIFGDRVQLASSFVDNQGNGWCLGKVSEHLQGVVIAIPPSGNAGGEQRNVMVYCEKSDTKLALFKSSWLERVPYKVKHRVGDLVRLNPATCHSIRIDDPMIAGKCLGEVKDLRFGVVTAIGSVVGGIQRNVQVALIDPSSASAESASKYMRVSLYCASKLMEVDAHCVDHPSVRAELTKAIKRAVLNSDGTYRLNAESLVHRVGLHAWSNLMDILGPSNLLEHVHSYIHACKGICLKGTLPNQLADYYAGVSSIGLDENSEAFPVVMDQDNAPSAKIPTVTKWVCKTCSWENPLTANVCAACTTKAEKWICLVCKIWNVVDLQSCRQCAVVRGKKSLESTEVPASFTTVTSSATVTAAAAAASVGETTRSLKGFKGPKILSKGNMAFAAAAVQLIERIEEVPIDYRPDPICIGVASNVNKRVNLFNGDVTQYWESPGASAHWIEFLVPDDKVLYNLEMFLKDAGILTPVDLRIFVIPQFIQSDPSYKLSISSGCDVNCTATHNGNDLCLVCGIDFGQHKNGHICANGGRASFSPPGAAGLKFSARYPPGSLIRVKTVTLPLANDDWFELISAEDCARFKPGLVRIEIARMGNKNCRIFGLRAKVVSLRRTRWKCRVCYEVNSELVTTRNCLNCYSRKPEYCSEKLSNSRLSQKREIRAKDVSTSVVQDLDPDSACLAWNCSQDALGRAGINDSLLTLPSLSTKSASAEQQQDEPDETEDSEPVLNPLAEELFNSTIVETSSFVITYDQLLGPPMDEDDEFPIPTQLQREESLQFWSNERFDPITDFNDLVRFRDRAGNSAAHHLAFMRLFKSYHVLLNNGGMHQRFKTNLFGQTSAGLADGISGKSREFLIHKYCTQRSLVESSTSFLTLLPLNYSESYYPIEKLSVVLQEIKNKEYDLAMERASAAGDDPNCQPHYRLYQAIASLFDGYGTKAAEIELEDYLQAVKEADVSLDPMYFYVLYLLFKIDKTPSKSARNRAADALSVFKLFPALCQAWLLPEDNLDEIVRRDDEANDSLNDDDNDDDDDELEEVLAPDSPEVLWRVAKVKRGVKSPAMDKLMSLTGLKKVKERALAVYQRTLVDPFRPKDVDASTAMNFLFIGNPGCGKTTVAELLAAALVELNFRKNPNPCLTSASKILKAKDPVAEFENMVQKAAGGTVFIDECYLFRPSPPGQQANPSNGVLDYLLEVAESLRTTTTFILAGYKEDVQQLLTYNEGFPSRFPKVFTFPFDDYSEPQLRSILLSMVKQRGFRFDSKKNCGVSIAKVLSMRIARGRGVKGFGNAREVRNQIDACIQRQESRFGALILKSTDPDFVLSPKEMITLTKADTIGERPNLETSPALMELDTMAGLDAVKRAVRGLMQLQLQNYDREMRGEDIERISLHRVFVGNPGTGKTTVARLYGRVLKEFGLLTDGDFIATTASSLMGEHVGAGATQTAQMLERARGKVLFIDEAYVLDPKRRGGNDYGGSVLDTLVEKIEGSAGMDMAVILAGYENEMLALFRNCGNPGLARRFQLSEALRFEDFSDRDLKIVLKRMVAKDRLIISPSTVEEAIRIISRRRRLPGFGNAGEVENFLGRAKASKALRLATAAADFDHARRTHPNSRLPAIPRPDVLVIADFATEGTSADKAKEGFATMQHLDHIYAYITRLEATILAKKREGKSPSEIVADAHMIFTGPPGTGKTTAARKFGQLFYHLELLPTDRVVETTGKTMLGQYVGQTAQLVSAKMEDARGGVLFIDEAYSLIPTAGSYASDALQTLLDNITKPEFKGNLVIILAGYERDLNMLFTVNAGLSSRFDKHRIAFPAWTAPQAHEATVAAIHHDNKTLTGEARDALFECYLALTSLPSWASARDVYETVLPSMYSHRAERLAREAQSPSVEATTSTATTVLPGARGEVNLPPYTTSDVLLACQALIDARGTIAVNLGHRPLEASGLLRRQRRSMSWNAGRAPLEHRDDGDGNGNDDNDDNDDSNDDDRNTNITVDSPGGVRDIASSHPNRWPATGKPAAAGDVGSKEAIACTDREESSKSPEGGDWNDEALFPADMPPPHATPSPPSDADSMSRQEAAIGMGDAESHDASNKKQTKGNCAVKFKKLDPDTTPSGAGEASDPSPGNLLALLEEACAELGYSIQQMEKFFESGTLPEQLVTLVWEKNGGQESSISLVAVTSALRRQIPGLLMKVRLILRQMEVERTEEEMRKQEKLRKIGKCWLGFVWLKVEGGYRCAGGSHYCSDAEVEQFNG